MHCIHVRQLLIFGYHAAQPRSPSKGAGKHPLFGGYADTESSGTIRVAVSSLGKRVALPCPRDRADLLREPENVRSAKPAASPTRAPGSPGPKRLRFSASPETPLTESAKLRPAGLRLSSGIRRIGIHGVRCKSWRARIPANALAPQRRSRLRIRIRNSNLSSQRATNPQLRI